MAITSLLMWIWRASWGTHSELVERDKKMMEMRMAIDEKLHEMYDMLNDEIDKKSQTLNANIDRNSRMIGGTIEAVRLHADLAHQRNAQTNQDVAKFEVWTRDNLVQRKDYKEDKEDYKESVRRLESKLDAIVTKLDGFVEKKIIGNHG